MFQGLNRYLFFATGQSCLPSFHQLPVNLGFISSSDAGIRAIWVTQLLLLALIWAEMQAVSKLKYYLIAFPENSEAQIRSHSWQEAHLKGAVKLALADLFWESSEAKEQITMKD